MESDATGFEGMGGPSPLWPGIGFWLAESFTEATANESRAEAGKAQAIIKMASNG
jgi:hypothetical protein